jgi:DNA polymerase III subunit chi
MPPKPPSVNFYPVSTRDAEAHLFIACRLVEKIIARGHRVHIHAADAEQARRMDELLWQFKAESFLPHRILDNDGENSAETENELQVTIGFAQLAPRLKDVLVNLAEQIYSLHGEFTKISDIVAADTGSLNSGRARYRYYQGQGYPLETHKL